LRHDATSLTGPHDFRRTFATTLDKFDLRQVQVLMGHESPETTARYDKRDLETLHEKARNTKVIA
jgi:integrase